MAVKAANKASSSKRTTAGSTAKASTTGPKPTSARTRAQAVAVVPVVQVDENAPSDQSTAMEVIPRYVKVPFGRTSRMNYQQARASTARKHGLPQILTTSVPMAMNRPPLTIFDAPTKVVLPSIVRRPSRIPTQPDVNARVTTPNNGGETDEGEETDTVAPRTPVNGQPPGDATDTEVVTESRDDGNDNTPSFLSVAVETDEDVTDVGGGTAPSTPTPVSRNVQHETSMGATTSSTLLQPFADGEFRSGNVSYVASEPQSFGGTYGSNLSAHQNLVADIWNNPRTEATPLTVDPCPAVLHYTPPQQWSIPTVGTYQQPLPSSIAYQPHNTTQTLARTGTDFDLATRLNQLNVQATYLPNGFERYAQVHPDTVAIPTVHSQGLNVSAPAGTFHYERPDALPPFSSIWPQSLGLYYPEPVPLRRTSVPAYPQTYQFYPQAPLHQSAPAGCSPVQRNRPHIFTTRTTIHNDPQPEWQAKMEEINERKRSELAQDLNPFQRMIGPRQRNYSGGKRGLLYMTKPGEEEPRKYIPLPARAKGVPRPAKGSEEDLIERIKRDGQLEAKATRRLEKKAEKRMALGRRLEAKQTHQAEKKAEKLARKSAKRDKRNANEETSRSLGSERPTKKQKASK